MNTQLQWEQIGETERKIVDFCIQSLEQSGYLMIPPKDIAKDLGVAEEQGGGSSLYVEGAGAAGTLCVRT